MQFRKGRTPKYGDSSVAVIKSGQARGGDAIDLTKLSHLDSGISPSLLQKGDVMINTTGVGTVGRITYFSLNGYFVTDSHISTLRITDESLYLSRYIFLVLNNLYTREYIFCL